LGALISNRTPNKPAINQNNKSKKEKLSTKDIYSANNSRACRDAYESSARKRYKASRDFKNTKIIPKNYKQLDEFNKANRNKINFDDDDSVYSDDQRTFDDNQSSRSRKSTGSDDGYHGVDQSVNSSMLDRMNSLTNNRKYESSIAKSNDAKGRDKFKEKNTWTRQYDLMRFDNPEGPVSLNNSNKNTLGPNASMDRIEMERQMEIDGGYSAFDKNDDGTYGVVRADSKDFIHGNMVPFVRKGPNPINESKRNMVNQMKLELFTGDANNAEWRPKIERAPLFSPLIGAKNIYGDPVRTDEYKSRYFAGNEKRNELPFQQVKVTPGLNIGYNAVGKQGYHDMYRVVPTEAYVDNLRTLNNPKISYGSYVGPGKKGDKGPIMGKVTQYKSPKFKEFGTKDMVRGRSYITAPTIYGEYDPKNLATINRGTKESVAQGPAQHHLEGITPGKYRGNYQAARKENYKYDHPRNLVMHESLAGQGHNNNSFVPDPTQREQKSLPGHAHNPATNKGYAVNYQNATPNTTMRDVHNRPDRAGHITGNKAQQHVVDWNDVADPTMRDIHNKPDRAGHISGNKAQQHVVDWNDVADPTMRDIHNKPDRAGHITGNKAQQHVVDWNDVADPTMRDIHNKPDRAGHVTGNRAYHHVVNWDDIPDPTMRDIHNKPDRAGNVTGDKAQQHVVNWDDVPDTTMREIHNKLDRAGHITGNKQQQRVINWDDVPDTTLREIHNKLDRAGHITGDKNQYQAINWSDVPDATMRDIHNKLDRAGHITGNKNQYQAINWSDVPDATLRDIHNKLDRAGHVTGEQNGYRTINWSDVPDATMRDIHNKLDRAGHISGNKNQYTAINWSDMPDPTMRDIHNKLDRAGHVTGNKEQHIVINWDDIPDPTMREMHPGGRAGAAYNQTRGYKTIDWDDIPDPTMREMHPGGRAGTAYNNTRGYKTIDWDDVPDPTMREIHPGGRVGGADSQNKRQGSRHQYMTMKVNAAKEALEEGRAPTAVGQNKGWTIDFTAFRSKDPLEWKWRPGPGSDIMFVNDKYPSINTNIPVGRFYENNRITAHTEENLKGNPLVSNLIHKSI
jgi:hypothetical protein